MQDEITSDLLDLKTALDENGLTQQMKLFRHDIFARFVEIFGIVDRDCRKLIIDLMKKYLIIKDYSNHINQISSYIETTFSGQNLIITPVFESSIIKSGHNVSYEFRSTLIESNFSSVDFPDGETALKSALNENSTIVIVDDFVGTGKQISEFISRNNLPKNNTHLTSIIIQSEALDNLNNAVSSVFSPNPYRNRAISDSFSIGTLGVDEAKEIYDRIESQLDVPIFYSYGFMGSEAIVSMKRTPDNTLPIFWCDKGKIITKWPAPFHRS